MTDNDDSHPPRDRPASSSGDDHERPDEARPHGVRAIGPASPAKGAHAAPTDPEVPSAKRRGAVRQQRSLIGVAMVVVGLLSITLLLLYRAGRSVGTSEGIGSPAGIDGPKAGDDVALSPRGSTERAPRVEPAAIPVSQPLPDLPDHSADDRVPAASAAPASKNPPPAGDIIRTPAF